mmetsp:Transcript_10622/g.26938  ORF Transcript_10622/g.26938 Transcript_10622/m.26938 type:complete len:366 (+) Transcript_10622:344-1441(+)
MATAARSTALADVSKRGAFVRTVSPFRKCVSSEPDAKHPPESQRYHLYVSHACPWANRAVIVAALKKLSPKHLSISVVHPTWQRTRPDDPEDTHCGWAFASESDAPFTSPSGFGSFACKDVVPDTVNNCKFVRDLYDLSLSKLTDEERSAFPAQVRFTVPILWDKKLGVIVNNESSEIIRMLNTEFDNLEGVDTSLDLYPEAKRAAIDEANEWIYDGINNGVYKCGFATSQEAYEEAYNNLYESLNRLEKLLTDSPYVAGDTLTEVDVRLFVTLARFDDVYTVYFKATGGAIRTDFPAILNYCRRLCQLHPEIAQSINSEHIRVHYYTSHPVLNHYAVVPIGRGIEPFLSEPFQPVPLLYFIPTR